MDVSRRPHVKYYNLIKKYILFHHSSFKTKYLMILIETNQHSLNNILGIFIINFILKSKSLFDVSFNEILVNIF